MKWPHVPATSLNMIITLTTRKSKILCLSVCFHKASFCCSRFLSAIQDVLLWLALTNRGKLYQRERCVLLPFLVLKKVITNDRLKRCFCYLKLIFLSAFCLFVLVLLCNKAEIFHWKLDHLRELKCRRQDSKFIGGIYHHCTSPVLWLCGDLVLLISVFASWINIHHNHK